MGQAETTVKRGRLANIKTNEAWDQYFAGRAEDAVNSFGSNAGMVYTFYQRVCSELAKLR